MFKLFNCKRVVKLCALLCCHTLILTVLLTPIRIISVVNLSEVDLPDVQDIQADFLHDSRDLLDSGKTHNETAVLNVSKTSSIVNTETLVNAKLDILRQLSPKLLAWYQEGMISNPPQPLANMTRNPVCALFKKEATVRRHTVLNVFGGEYPSQNSYGITLATQGTINRMRPFIETAKNWEGPIQVVFHLGHDDFANLTTVFAEEDARKYILERKNIIVNFVVKIGNFYPINYLRNVGLNNTRTQWIFLMDIDFVPSKEVYTAALEFLKDRNAETEKKVYVVPAFSDEVGNLSHFPENKTQLMKLWKTNLVLETQKGTAGQKNTDYKRWAGATSPYMVKWKTDYEPYIIGPTKNLPTYDEYFLQRVLDKCAQIMETSVKGFEFWVLPDLFIIHLKHERKGGQEYHAGCAHDYYHKEFKVKVRKKYNVGVRRLTRS